MREGEFKDFIRLAMTKSYSDRTTAQRLQRLAERIGVQSVKDRIADAVIARLEPFEERPLTPSLRGEMVSEINEAIIGVAREGCDA